MLSSFLSFLQEKSPPSISQIPLLPGCYVYITPPPLSLFFHIEKISSCSFLWCSRGTSCRSSVSSLPFLLSIALSPRTPTTTPTLWIEFRKFFRLSITRRRELEMDSEAEEKKRVPNIRPDVALEHTRPHKKNGNKFIIHFARVHSLSVFILSFVLKWFSSFFHCSSIDSGGTADHCAAVTMWIVQPGRVVSSVFALFFPISIFSVFFCSAPGWNFTIFSLSSLIPFTFLWLFLLCEYSSLSALSFDPFHRPHRPPQNYAIQGFPP